MAEPTHKTESDDLLSEAERLSHEIRSPKDAITALCMVSAHIMRLDGYTYTNDCFCGERDDWVAKGLWACEGSSIRRIIQLVRDDGRTIPAGLGLWFSSEDGTLTHLDGLGWDASLQGERDRLLLLALLKLATARVSHEGSE